MASADSSSRFAAATSSSGCEAPRRKEKLDRLTSSEYTAWCLALVEHPLQVEPPVLRVPEDPHRPQALEVDPVVVPPVRLALPPLAAQPLRAGHRHRPPPLAQQPRGADLPGVVHLRVQRAGLGE